MSYDVEALRAEFPSLASGVAHFDGPGGSQVPAAVARAVQDAMLSPMSVRGAVTEAEQCSEQRVLDCRLAAADLLNADPRGVVFGRSMTQLTYDFARTLAKDWVPGDEIVVSRLDHDANIRPWIQAADATGASVRWIDFDPDTGELAPEQVANVLTERTRLVAVTAASNLIGTRPDLPAISHLVRQSGALLYVDAVHLAPHAPVDAAAFGADLIACSPYKVLGPHCGLVAVRPELLEQWTPEKLAPSTNQIPERFEFGTLPYELMAGTTAAIDFLAGLTGEPGSRRQRLVAALTAVEAHEAALLRRLEDGLAQLPDVVQHSRASRRTPTLLLTFARHQPVDAYRFLAQRGINAPAGNFYALEASRHLGLGDAGGLRVGLAAYTTEHEIDRLLDGLAAFLA